LTADLTEAIRDFDRCIEQRHRVAAESLLDDDYALVLVVPSPAVMPRPRWLEVLADYLVEDYLIEEQIVNEDGPHAAVLTRARMRATVLGEDRSGVFVISDFWRMSNGHWRLWRRHSTPLTAGALPGAAG
jgi:hypothetical protein